MPKRRKEPDPHLVDAVLRLPDLEDHFKNRIRELIIQSFKSRGDKTKNATNQTKLRHDELAKLVAALLESQGYEVSLGKQTRDGGADMVARMQHAAGDWEKLIVQVKTNQSDEPDFRDLRGTVELFRADRGLLVAIGGFKYTVDKLVKRDDRISIRDADKLAEMIMENWGESPEQQFLPEQRYWLQLPGGFRNRMQLRQMPFLCMSTADNGRSGDQELDENEIDQVLSSKHLEEYAHRHICSHVEQLDAAELAKVVADILRAEGYRAECEPFDSDNQTDIRAIRSRSVAYPPRLHIRVAKSETEVDRATIQSFLASLEDTGVDMAAFVSCAGFSAEARADAWNEFYRLRIYDLTAIAEEVIENYEDLSNETRTQIPLRWIWTLVPS